MGTLVKNEYINVFKKNEKQINSDLFITWLFGSAFCNCVLRLRLIARLVPLFEPKKGVFKKATPTCAFGKAQNAAFL